jgi:hypothetical protein
MKGAKKAIGMSAVGRIGAPFGTLFAALREIFDESAYTRFLARTQMKSSSAAYAAFWREREASHARRTKCC